jgi:hypothetical protein
VRTRAAAFAVVVALWAGCGAALAAKNDVEQLAAGRPEAASPEGSWEELGKELGAAALRLPLAAALG